MVVHADVAPDEAPDGAPDDAPWVLRHFLWMRCCKGSMAQMAWTRCPGRCSFSESGVVRERFTSRSLSISLSLSLSLSLSREETIVWPDDRSRHVALVWTFRTYVRLRPTGVAISRALR